MFLRNLRDKIGISFSNYKMPKRYLISFFVALFAFLAGAHTALAGFGISPPYVYNKQLVPGAHYEQRITLLRSSAEDELRAQISVNAPDIDKWITIDKGNDFAMPKGELQVPMIVNVDVPKDAAIGDYKGYINVRIAPANQNTGGGVAIALGARIDIDLTLTNVTFSDFMVRLVSIPDVERLGKPWSWKYIYPIFEKLFYRVMVVMNVQNTGNVDTAPTKIQLDVYDLTENKLLETTETASLNKVKSYSTGEIQAFFPTTLPAGQYWAKIKIYKDNEITNSYKIAFTVADAGGLGGKARSLGYGPWLVLGAMVLAVLIVIFILIRIRIWRYIILLIVIIFGPVYRKLGSIIIAIKAAFWRWIRQKAEQKTDKYDK